MIIRRKTCFLSYPWGDAPSEAVIRASVRPALERVGWRISDPRETQPGTGFFDSIARSLRESDLVIADLSRMNSNVAYELN